IKAELLKRPAVFGFKVKNNNLVNKSKPKSKKSYKPKKLGVNRIDYKKKKRETSEEK
ncbi:6914_t:CDS:1, partial [Scutellospora calospora]